MRTTIALTLLFTLVISAFTVQARDVQKPYYCHGAFRAMPYRTTGGFEARMNPYFRDYATSAQQLAENTKNSLY